MSDPATDPAHDLLDHPQDTVREPRVRLGTFLSWLRILAGYRGHASVRWAGAGFTYTISVRRRPGPPAPVLDADPDGLELLEARTRVLGALDQ
jgi:hypothetical protein